MTVRDREVLETLRDEPELLAIADAIAATRRRHNRSWERRAAAVAVSIAALLALVLVAPWSGERAGILDRASAAIGDRPVLHAVLLIRTGIRVDLRTGREFAPLVRQEIWIDSDRDRSHWIVSQDGRFAGESGGPARQSFAAFEVKSIEFYRHALEDHRARLLGPGRFHGRLVTWVEISGPRTTLRVALDRRSYRPVVFRAFAGGRLVFEERIVTLETLRRKPGQFRTQREMRERHPGYTDGGPETAVGYSLRDVRFSLAGRVVWPGRIVAGRTLSEAQVWVQSRRLEGQRRRRTTTTVRLSYGSDSARYGPAVPALSIEEATPRDAGPLWLDEGQVPPPLGYIDLTKGIITNGTDQKGRVRWEGRLQKNGLYVTLGSWSRAGLIDAARLLRPVPRNP